MEVINGYKLHKKIGKHSFVAEKGGERFVVQQFKRYQYNQNDLVGFREEVGRLIALNHPGIPEYVELIENDQYLMVVRRLINGSSFQDQIRHQMKLTPAKLIKYLKQGLDILGYLNEQSPPLIHGYLAPKYIFIDQNDRLYITNFHNIHNTITDDHIKNSGVYSYVPLEMLNGSATSASDIYSFGLALLARYNGTSLRGLPKDSRTGLLDREVAVRTMPKPLWPVISGMIAARQENRLRNASAVFRALSEVEFEEEVSRETKIVGGGLHPHPEAIHYFKNQNDDHIFDITEEGQSREEGSEIYYIAGMVAAGLLILTGIIFSSVWLMMPGIGGIILMVLLMIFLAPDPVRFRIEVDREHIRLYDQQWELAQGIALEDLEGVILKEVIEGGYMLYLRSKTEGELYLCRFKDGETARYIRKAFTILIEEYQKEGAKKMAQSDD